MKSRYKIVFLLIALSMTGILTNCSDDSEDGAAVISYIRVTDPTSSDSLLVAAGQGQMVAIIGRNLQNTTQVWFNDQQAELTGTFVTSTSIIVRIPSQIPEVLTHKLKLIFASGESLIYDFTVIISRPAIDRMKSEYVSTGETATFYGDYFYAPIAVMFSGGVMAEIVSVEDQELQVKVPDGAQEGPVTIATNFGVTESAFWFRDTRNIIASFDVPLVDGMWKGSDYIVTTDANIPDISGKFLRANSNLGTWPFFEWYGGPKEGDVAIETKNIPADAFDNPSNYSLKFEVNTLASLTGANMRIYIGHANGAGFDAARQSTYYIWAPNLNTEGEWETVTIPWEDVHADNNSFAFDASGYGMFIYFHGPNAVNTNIGMDNMRVVPN
jgi:hypothetical protein